MIEGDHNPPGKLPRLTRVANFTYDGDDDDDGVDEDRAKGLQDVCPG